MKHSPGPWRVQRFEAPFMSATLPRGADVFSVFSANDKDLVANVGSGTNDIANARLIAAAPALLDALRELLKHARESNARDVAEVLVSSIEAA